MQISKVDHGVKASDVSIESLAKNKQIPEQEKIAELCRQFEAVLLRQILQDSQKTVIRSDLLHESSTQGIYRDMANSQLAEKLSHGGGLGLAATLEKEMTRQLAPHPRPGEVQHES